MATIDVGLLWTLLVATIDVGVLWTLLVATIDVGLLWTLLVATIDLISIKSMVATFSLNLHPSVIRQEASRASGKHILGVMKQN